MKVIKPEEMILAHAEAEKNTNIAMENKTIILM